TVLAPRDREELTAMLKFALSFDGPVAIRYPKGTSPQPRREQRAPIVYGRAETIINGTDVVLISLGSMTPVAEAAASRLAESGVSCAVVDARFASPIDRKTILDIAARRMPIVTLEEGCIEGGMGSAIAQIIAQLPGSKKARVLNLGIPRVFVEHGSRDRLLREFGLDPESVAARVLELLAPLGATAPVHEGLLPLQAKGEEVGQGTS
ncbi:MAG: transketolase C-terminal domain-containing protein, partial [Bacillota bacterium]